MDLAPGDDVRFQHFAIVARDMRAAFERLRNFAGWTRISRGGPRRLPASSGGVTAFKFRDPEGHPIELLHFPSRPGALPTIDHTAISVYDAEKSIVFTSDLASRSARVISMLVPNRMRSTTSIMRGSRSSRSTPRVASIWSCSLMWARSRVATRLIYAIGATRIVLKAPGRATPA